MANISVRNIDDETYRRLKKRAARSGVSMEEEVRRILNRAVAAPERLGDLMISYFGPENGVDLELRPREPHEPPDLLE